jgi:hypothetical protein
MSQKRASKGGEVGINGEWYPAGSFICNTTLSKMQKAEKKAASRKVQIEVYKWEVAPEGKRSIYSAFAGVEKALLTNNLSLINEQTIRYYGLDMVQLAELAQAYHNGERWY